MSRSSIPRVRLLAAALLATMPAAALAQTAPSDVLVPAPAVAAAPQDVLAFTTEAAEPQVPLEIAVVTSPLAGQGLFAFAPGAQAPSDAGQPPHAGAFFFTQGAAPPIEVQARIDEAAGAPASEYWIGVQLEPLPEIITSQLKLERGMVVVQVFDDSPAAKAEVKTHDIILRAADKDIKEPGDLIAAVNDAKDKELPIIVLRGGTETALKVTPAKRQADQLELRVSPETPHVEVVRALEKLYQRAPDGDVRLFAVRPGGVYAYAAQGAKFPSNLEVTIEKRGEQPAKIRVKRIHDGEDKSWEVTEEKIDELPEDIRIHVQQMLGGHDPASGRLRLQLEARATAEDQAAQAQAKMRETQQHLDRTLREYRLRVQPPPAPRATPVAPPVPAPPTRMSRVVVAQPGDASVLAKLDAILKKLDQQQGETLQRLQAEVERLRKDLDDLRQEKK